MASIPLEIGALPNYDNDVPQHRTNKTQLCCANMADQDTGVTIWRNHSQVMGQQAQPSKT